MTKINLILIWALLLCGGLSSCKDDKNDAKIKSEMVVRMAFPQLFFEETNDMYIIPYSSLYAKSENEEIAIVEGYNVVGKSLGNTVINLYKDESMSELVKKIRVEILPTAEIELTCGYNMIFQDIPAINETGLTYYFSNFTTTDDGVAILQNGDQMTFSIEALMPGRAYISNTHVSGGDVIVEVNVEKYTGPQPFPIPDNLKYLMDVTEVKNVMQSYYLKEEGSSVLFNQKYATTLVYAPYGDAESITLYIGEGLSLSTQYQKDKLLGFKIVPSSGTQEVVSYLLSNYILDTSSWANSSIWSGYRKFDSENGWFIISGADNWSPAWSSIEFYAD